MSICMLIIMKYQAFASSIHFLKCLQMAYEVVSLSYCSLDIPISCLLYTSTHLRAPRRVTTNLPSSPPGSSASPLLGPSMMIRSLSDSTQGRESKQSPIYWLPRWLTGIWVDVLVELGLFGVQINCCTECNNKIHPSNQSWGGLSLYQRHWVKAGYTLDT